MGMQGKHCAGKPTEWRRPAALVTAGVASTALATIAAYVAVSHSGDVRAAVTSRPGATQTPGSAGETANLAIATRPRLSLLPKSDATAPVLGSVALTTRDHSACPPAAAACVDLSGHLTWLQADGKVTFGPIRAEPGPPGSAHATPRGIFQVSWRAGPTFISNIYHEPMPWAVFFAPGGIAFHGGSLTTPSHGCVHLTDENAHYYNQHLPDGAEVVVF